MPASQPAALPASSPTGATRRAVLLTTAWAVPTVTLSVGTPAFAGSADTVSARVADPELQRRDRTTLTVTIVSGAGEAKSGRAVELSVSGTAVTAEPLIGVTDAQGVFTSTLTVAPDAEPGVRTVTVATPDGTTAASVDVVGALMLSAASSSLVTGTTSTVRARLVDAQGLPRAGERLTFEGDGPVAISPSYENTDQDGSASSRVTVPTDAAPGTYTLSVHSDTSDEASTTVTVVPALALSVSPSSQEQGGTAQATVTARDSSGRLAEGVDVTLTVADGPDDTPTGVTVSPATVRTGAQGSAVTTVNVADHALVGTATLIASTSTARTSATLTVLAPVIPLDIALESSVVGWGKSTTVTVTATHPDRTPVAGASVSLAVVGSDVTLSATSGTTDSHGRLTLQATVSSSPSTSGERIITAAQGSTTGRAVLNIDAVRTRITGFTRPSDIAIANTTAYVVDGARVVVLSTQTNAILRTAALPAVAYDMVMAGGKLAYLNAGDGRVFVYTPGSNKVTATITGRSRGLGSGQIAAQQSKFRVYACLPFDDVLMVLDTQTNTPITELSFPRVGGVAVGRGDFTMFVYALDGDGVLHVILASDNSVLDSVDLGIGATGPMTVSSDGETGYIAADDGENAWLVTVNLRSLEVLSKTSIPTAASGVMLSPDGTRVYAASLPGILTGISTSDHSRIGAYTAGSVSSSLAISSDGQKAYVTNYDSDAPGVSVVDIR